MKKGAVVLILSVLCITLLTGCSGASQAGVSEQVYKVGKNTIACIDKYLDGDISLAEAKSTMSGMSDLIVPSNSKTSIQEAKELSIKILIRSLHFELLGPKQDIEEIIRLRNKLADELKIKKR